MKSFLKPTKYLILKTIILISIVLLIASVFLFRIKIKQGYFQLRNYILSKIGTEVLLDVPFIPQVGFEDNTINDLGCEEVSILMVKDFLNKETHSREESLSEIKKMVDFQIKKFGYQPFLDASGIGLLAKEVYELEPSVYSNAGRKEITEQLKQGNPVIVPAWAKELKNPFYPHYEGYHTVVVTGLSGNEFIVNDPGTEMGSRYRYSFETLEKAMYNFGKQEKDILILKRRGK